MRRRSRVTWNHRRECFSEPMLAFQGIKTVDFSERPTFCLAEIRRPTRRSGADSFLRAMRPSPVWCPLSTSWHSRHSPTDALENPGNNVTALGWPCCSRLRRLSLLITLNPVQPSLLVGFIQIGTLGAILSRVRARL